MKRLMGEIMFWIAVILFAAIIAAVAAYFIGRQVESNKQERQQMRTEITELKAQVASWTERTNGRHLTNRMTAGIEDATAIAIDMVFEIQALEARVDNLRDVLGILRNRPHEYDPDRPCGRRGARG